MPSNNETTTNPTPPGVQEKTWDKFKGAFQELLLEVAPSSSNTANSSGPATQPDDLRKMVTEAVSAVLLESDLLEKLVQRILQNQMKAEGGIGEDIKALCLDTLRSFSMQTFGPLMKTEIKDIVHSKLTEFANTEEFKSALDGRFRALETYLKSDVLPREVAKILEAETA